MTDPRVQQALDRAAAGDVASAVAQLRRLGPRAEALFHLGTLLAERGDPEGARRLAEAAALDPSDDAILNNLGHAQRESGDAAASAETFQRLTARRPEQATAWYGLGAAWFKAGRWADAERALATAARLAPDLAPALRLWGDCLEAMGRRADAIERLRRAVVLAPQHAPTLRRLGLLYAVDGRAPLAVATLRQALRIAPDPLAAHFLRALTGDAPERPDDAYVVDLFDAFADSYDAHLVDALATQVPAWIDAALPGPVGRVADLGCGTGLVGARLRPRARWLVGVDLSPKMLARAAQRGGYDTLTCGGLQPWLDAAAPAWDTVVLADVLAYVGAVAPVFAGARRALAPGGRLALTTERHDGDGVSLRPTGRYAHGTAAVLAAAAAAGLVLVDRAEGPLRKEAGAWVDGERYVFGVAGG